MSMRIRPIHLREAKRFIKEWHAHHAPPIGYKFALGLFEGKDLIGCATVGRPTAWRSDSEKKKEGIDIAEVTRLCVKRDENGKGVPNACSKLYAACARVAKEMGYNYIQTFILESEPGTSLKACGWEMIYISPGKSHSVPSRPRKQKQTDNIPKPLYRKQLTAHPGKEGV